MIEVRLADPLAAPARGLIDALTDEMAPLYPPENTFGYAPDALVAETIAFFTAFEGDRAVGIVGVEDMREFSELKRMFVVPDRRGGGVADALLDAAVDRARQNGHRLLRLETGDKQHAAIRVYERRGFRRIPRYGVYAASVTSVCMELELG